MVNPLTPNEQDAWADARRRLQDVVMPKLHKYAEAIGRCHKTNPAAGDVVKYYEMLHRSFDPMTLRLLEEALDRYVRS